MTQMKLTFALALLCLATASQGMRAEQTVAASHEQQGEQYLRAHQPQQALREFLAAVETDPRSLNAQANAGVLLYFSGKVQQAVPHLRAALALDPSQAKLQALLGFCEHRLGQLTDAQRDLIASLPHLSEAKIQKQAGLESLEILTALNDLSSAGPVLEQLRTVAPSDPEVQYAAYRVYTDLAAESLLSLSIAAPKSTQMQQAIAHELFRVRDYPGAIASFRRALAIDPKLPGVHTELAETLEASPDEADRSKAEAEYRSALAEDSRDVLATVHLADMRANAGDTAEATRLYTEALSLQPANASALLGMAKIESDAGRDAQALDRLKTVVQADEYNVLAHFRLSALYRKLHRPEEAKQELAEYQRLKVLKEELRTVYSTMKLHAPDAAATEGKP